MSQRPSLSSSLSPSRHISPITRPLSPIFPAHTYHCAIAISSGVGVIVDEESNERIVPLEN